MKFIPLFLVLAFISLYAQEPPILKLTHTAPASVFLHGTISCEFVVKNASGVVAEEVKVISTLPNELDYISSTPKGAYKPSAKKKSATVTWVVENMEAKQKIKFALNLRAKATGNTIILVRVTSQEGSRLKEKISISITGVPALHLSGYDTEDPLEAGENTTYVAEVRNEGTSDCTNVVCRYFVPKAMEFISAEGPKSFRHNEDNRQVIFDGLPVLPPGEMVAYKIVCKGLEPGGALHKASIRFDQFPSEIFTEEQTSICPLGEKSAALHISTYDTEDPIGVGKTTAYMVEVRNEGSVDCSNIVFEGVIPEGLEFIKAEGNEAFRYDAEKNTVIFDPVQVLKPGEVAKYKVICKAVKEGGVKFQAIVKGDQCNKEIVHEEPTSIYK